MIAFAKLMPGSIFLPMLDLTCSPPNKQHKNIEMYNVIVLLLVIAEAFFGDVHRSVMV